MTFVSCPEVAEAVIHFTGDGASMANVLHFRKIGGYDQAAIDALASAVDISVGANYLGIMHPGITYVNTTVRGLENIVDLSGEANGEAGPGTSGTETLPNNVTFCVTLGTGRTGRSARGRFYAVGVPPLSLNTQNTVDQTYSNAVENVVQGIINDAGSEGWELVVLSKFSNKAPRLIGVAYKVITVRARNLDIDSQRGRLRPNH